MVPLKYVVTWQIFKILVGVKELKNSNYKMKSIFVLLDSLINQLKLETLLISSKAILTYILMLLSLIRLILSRFGDVMNIRSMLIPMLTILVISIWVLIILILNLLQVFLQLSLLSSSSRVIMYEDMIFKSNFYNNDNKNGNIKKTFTEFTH